MAGRAETERDGTELATELWPVVVAVEVAVTVALMWERLPLRAEATAAPVKETERELVINRRESKERQNEHYCRERTVKITENKKQEEEQRFDANIEQMQHQLRNSMAGDSMFAASNATDGGAVANADDVDDDDGAGAIDDAAVEEDEGAGGPATDVGALALWHCTERTARCCENTFVCRKRAADTLDDDDDDDADDDEEHC